MSNDGNEASFWLLGLSFNDGGLQDKDWDYSWYDSDSPDGEPGTTHGGRCFTDGRCDTEKYVEDVNALRFGPERQTERAVHQEHHLVLSSQDEARNHHPSG